MHMCAGAVVASIQSPERSGHHIDLLQSFIGQSGIRQHMKARQHACRWVLATNGDNEYSYNAFQRLVAQPRADIVAFDFYSRYQRATGPPCLRFAASDHFSNCKKNRSGHSPATLLYLVKKSFRAGYIPACQWQYGCPQHHGPINCFQILIDIAQRTMTFPNSISNSGINYVFSI